MSAFAPFLRARPASTTTVIHGPSRRRDGESRRRLGRACAPVVEGLERRQMLSVSSNDTAVGFHGTGEAGCPIFQSPYLMTAVGNEATDATSPYGVRYIDGVPIVRSDDLLSAGFGTLWGHTRVWGPSVGFDPSAETTTPLANGLRWSVEQMPFLVQDDSNTIIAVDGGTSTRWFDGTGPYTARSFVLDTLAAGDSGELVITATDGSKTVYHDFTVSPSAQRGKFKSFTDAYGTQITTTYNGSGQQTEAVRSYTSGTVTVKESLLYTYSTVGSYSLLSNVTLRRKTWDTALSQTEGGTSYTTVRQVDYDYYDGSLSGAHAYGQAGALRRAIVKDKDGNVLSTTYYRYYTSGTGYAGGLKYVVGPEAYERLDNAVADPLTAGDNDVATHADDYFEYDAKFRVTEHVVRGAGSSSATAVGQGTQMLEFANNPATDPNLTSIDYNVWRRRVIETLPDGHQDVVYLNEIGQPMLKVRRELLASKSISLTNNTTTATATATAHGYQPGDVVVVSGASRPEYNGTFTVTEATADTFKYVMASSPGGSDSATAREVGRQWGEFAKYDSAGRKIMGAGPEVLDMPRNLTTLEPYDLLLDNEDSDSNSNYYFLKDDAGLVTLTDYYADTVGGGAAGYYKGTRLSRGEKDASPDALDLVKYASHTAGSVTIYLTSEQKVYRNAGDANGPTTSYSYTFFTGTNQVESVTTTLPSVSTNQNGSGSSNTLVSFFDLFGNLTWSKDGGGFINAYEYSAATGAMTKSIIDVATSQTSNEPSGWSTPTGGGLHLVTLMEVDSLGRTTKLTTPEGRTTYYVFRDPQHEVRTYVGWTGSAATGPTTVVREDLARGYVETLTMSATPAVSGGAPTGTESIGSLQSLARDYFNVAGQLTHSDRYHSLAGVTYSTSADLGTLNANYYRTKFGYDAGGRMDRTESATRSGQVDTFTPANVEVGDLFTLTATDGVNNASVSFTATAATVADVTAGLAAAWNASTNALHTPVTAFDLGTSLYLRADSGGVSFSVSASTTNVNGGAATQTLTRTATRANGTGGTIGRTVFDALGRQESTWVGTDDTPTSGSWSPANTAGTDLVKVSAYEFDGGCMCGGHSTKVTEYPGGTAEPRVTLMAYNWRNELVAVKGGSQSLEDSAATQRPITYYSIDNLGRTTAVERYDADGVWVGDWSSGSLDTTFNGTGKVTTDIDGSSSTADAAYAVTLQSDGRSVAVGKSGNNLAVARYNPDGSLDTTFSGDGKLTLDFGGTDEARAVAIDGSGRILVAGFSGNDFALARFHPDGSLDATFDGPGAAGDGKFTLDFGGTDAAYALAIDSSERILVAGKSGNDFAIARLSGSTGAYDADFDGPGTAGNGKFTFSITAGADEARALALQSDGNIVVAGTASDDLAVARLLASTGAYDTSFNTTGKRTTNVGLDPNWCNTVDHAYAVAIHLDGDILVAGDAGDGSTYSDFALVRYTPAGALETSFGGGDGIVTTSFESCCCSAIAHAYALTIQPNGRAVAGGQNPFSDFLLARYDVDGSLDASFDGDGMVGTDFSTGSTDGAYALARQADDRLLAVGVSGVTFALARYAGGDGVPDAPASSLRRAKATTEFDDLGRAFRSSVFSVNQSTGVASTDALDTESWFDSRGNLLKLSEPGGLVTKFVTDGAGRNTLTYLTDGGGDSVYGNAADVAGDKVLEQVETAFDDDGLVKQVTTRRRFHDDTVTGALADHDTAPRARVSHVKTDHDAAGRPTGTADFGTYGGEVPGEFDGTNRHRFPWGSAMDDHLWVEAEDGVFTCGAAGSGSAYAVTADTLASAGDYVSDADNSPTELSTSEGSDLAAAATFTFTTAASSATYRFWLRAWADDSNDDSVWVSVDGDANWVLAEVSTGSAFAWNLATDRDNSYAVLEKTLSAGTHTLTLYVREDGLRIDKLLVTKNLSYTPTGTGGTATAAAETAQLVTDFAYDAAGNLRDVTDPMGRVLRRESDALGRELATVENYVDGTPSGDTDRTTRMLYDGSNHLVLLTADLPGSTGDQSTEYLYGVSGDIASLDLLAQVIYPSKDKGSPSIASTADREAFTYNALGEVKTSTDRNQTVHTFTRDVLGRMVSDAVTTLGSGVDGAVRRLEYGFNTAGLPETFTSYSAASGGSVVNQVQLAYNGLGQVTAEYQSHSGAVNVGSTPKVQYTYSEMASGANHSRLTQVTYPGGSPSERVLKYGYNSGLDDAVSRVSYLGPTSGTHYEDYSYLGLTTIVKRDRPENGVGLTYDSGNDTITGDAGDRYVGLNRFDQISDQRWATSGGTDKDRFAYTYDRNSNRKSRDVQGAGSPSNLDEAYFYDGLNRLIQLNRGSVSGGTITDANATYSQSWDLDGVGNWDEFTTDTNGAGTPGGEATETRDHNGLNQITDMDTVGGSGNEPEYDANGNMTEDEEGFDYTFDAWNHLATFTNGTVSQTYASDALGRRIVEDPSNGDATDLYYSLGGQVLEERVGGATELQNVWGLGYVNQLVLRDRETPAEGTLDERLYVQQDANYNVTSVIVYNTLTSAWVVGERYTYLPYGGQKVLNGEIDTVNGDWTADDTLCGGAGDSDYLVTVGSQGGRRDTLTGDVHFGERDYDVELGRWKTADHVGQYVDGMGLYEFVRGNPATLSDPFGLMANQADAVKLAEFIESVRAWEQRYPNKSPCEILALLGERYSVKNWGGPGSPWPFLYASKVSNGGWIDVGHFITAADRTRNAQNFPLQSRIAVSGHLPGLGGKARELPVPGFLRGATLPPGSLLTALAVHAGGLAVEVKDLLGHSASAFTPEDVPSNFLGALFGAWMDCDKKLSDQLNEFLTGWGAGPDPSTAPSWRSLPPNEAEWVRLDRKTGTPMGWALRRHLVGSQKLYLPYAVFSEGATWFPGYKNPPPEPRPPQGPKLYFPDTPPGGAVPRR